MPESLMGTTATTVPLDTPWDYLVVSIHARHNDVLEKGLKERGSEGWELVFINMPMSNEYQCIFRRPAR